MPVRRWLMAVCVCLGAPATFAAEPHLATDLQRLSYMIGLQVGQNIARQGFLELDTAAFALAVQDALNGTPPRVTAEQAKAAQAGYRQALVERQEQRATENLASGKTFLEANAARDGVVQLDSGVQYRVIKEGEGDSPAVEDTVTVHYRGMLLDGREFDSSYGRGEPLTFGLNGVISGWQQVLPRMRPGGSIETWIPAEHAYGLRGSPPLIGPNAVLHFQIELLGVKDQE